MPATSFLGRERELGEVLAMLGRGEGASGDPDRARRDREDAARVAGRSRSVRHFADGVFWVPLAPLRDPSLAFSSVAEALDVKEVPGRELWDVLAERLAGKRMLVLLDNAEHLLPELAETVARLVAVGGLTVLVTSRERLQLQPEHIFNMPPRQPRRRRTVSGPRQRAGRSGRTIDRTEELCRRLEELRLAIELAVAQRKRPDLSQI